MATWFCTIERTSLIGLLTLPMRLRALLLWWVLRCVCVVVCMCVMYVCARVLERVGVRACALASPALCFSALTCTHAQMRTDPAFGRATGPVQGKRRAYLDGAQRGPKRFGRDDWG